MRKTSGSVAISLGEEFPMKLVSLVLCMLVAAPGAGDGRERNHEGFVSRLRTLNELSIERPARRLAPERFHTPIEQV